MTSPFAAEGVQNATLTFSIPGSTTTTDADGNVIAATTDRAIVAFLKRQAKTQQLTRLAGVSETAEYYQGYCVDPMKLPTGIRLQSWAPGTIGGIDGWFCLSGINAPYGSAGIGSLIEAEAGTRIEGWFQLER